MNMIDLETIFQNLPQGITVLNKDGKVIYANQKAVEMTGLNSTAELINKGHTIAKKFTLLDEFGRVLPVSGLPSRLALKSQKLETTVLRFKYASSNIEKWSWVQAAPIFDQQNNLQGVLNTFYDITDIKKSEQILKLLNQISNKLLGSIDYEEGLKKFASLVIPTVADWCGIDMLDEKGELVQIALTHINEEKVPIAKRLRTEYPPPKDQTSGVWNVLRTGKPEIYTTITKQLIIDNAINKTHQDLLLQLNLRSVIMAPLSVRGKVVGVISFAYSDSGREFTKSDMPIIEAITHRAALLLDNAMLFATTSRLLQAQEKTLQDLTESENTLRDRKSVV